MFGSLTSPKRELVSTLRLIHSLARRACILNDPREHGAVQLMLPLKIHFFIRLNDDKSIALKLHLDGFAAATTEERLQ